MYEQINMCDKGEKKELNDQGLITGYHISDNLPISCSGNTYKFFLYFPEML